MNRLKIACVFGTRPEAIKMAPVIRALASRPEIFDVRTICTGQHRELIAPLTDWFELDVAVNMDVMTPNQGLNKLAGKLLIEFEALFSEEHFDGVIGQGDTTTVFTSALAAFHKRIPFFHVEAGLRTFDMKFPFPEEMNRVLVGRLASLHFAPTDQAAGNLASEGVTSDSIFMVGNTVIDALNFTVDKLPATSASDGRDSKLILVTAHRRENFGEPLERICNAIRRIAINHENVRFAFPVHPNPNVRKVVDDRLRGLQNVDLMDPLPYPVLVDYLKRCDLVLTDSGGLQEEAPALSKPVLVLREETERPELVQLGGSILVGSSEALIYDSVAELLTNSIRYKQMVVGSSPYGDGHASQKIAEHVHAFFERSKTA
ncbi:UDP-N-Acetylglucosamine 2-epimerase [Rhizobium tibeticum]|uniref:UDP-N-acetylglucosamine 2-epimerase (non-hydrolyzing) n=1 Tax=Rhizobium tibeticum TaxID=501024 RepID=A0A1H8NTV4_9HYPH|nr:UDP-N-acetylglucosamine 2-epimerase (non-hydrolyzing) [Rhizobium tibeticum]SEI00382.1 UDP-N-acetylglucosamine 2-epimerase [Rhizobium tibeticum]SEO33021.1 UDP-N-Acetylglucosamine 2-epimerase [Rhizobium tibeticum]